MFRDLHTLGAFHLERLGNDRDRQNAKFLRNLSHNRCGTRTGTATHSRRDEQHVRTFDHLENAVTIFHRCLTTDIRVGTSTEPFRNIAADLQRRSCVCSLQRLRVRIRTDEIDALYTGFNHVRDRVATTATDTDDFDDSARAMRIH